jgi:hypothetical protein
LAECGREVPDVPRDVLLQFSQMMVAIIPSLDFIVRMGLKEDPEFDFNGMLRIVGV